MAEVLQERSIFEVITEIEVFNDILMVLLFTNTIGFMILIIEIFIYKYDYEKKFKNKSLESIER